MQARKHTEGKADSRKRTLKNEGKEFNFVFLLNLLNQTRSQFTLEYVQADVFSVFALAETRENGFKYASEKKKIFGFLLWLWYKDIQKINGYRRFRYPSFAFTQRQSGIAT